MKETLYTQDISYEKYSRQIILDEIGIEGQKKLSCAKILIIGMGGLGSPAAMYLAACGVGALGIADADKVDISNMQRQIIHTVSNIGKEKVISAKERLLSINPNIKIKVYDFFINSQNIDDIISDYDFIIEATDNFESKFLINDACVRSGKAFSHAGILGFAGQLMTYLPGKSPCFRCIFESPPPPDKNVIGVIGAVPGVIGSLQAMEAIKYITGSGKLLAGELLTANLLSMDFRKIDFSAAFGKCPLCRKNVCP